MITSRKQNYKKNIYNKISQKKNLKGGVLIINGIELKPNTVFPDEFDFRDHHLSGVNLSGSTLIKANFKGVDLYNANLNGANLTSANFESANLNNANLNHADLTNARFVLAKLKNANLNNAILDVELDAIRF